jgi:sugar porter (SP) family MFS transporter
MTSQSNTFFASAAVLELGALLGALSAGMLADKYSRRHSIFLASVVFIIGSVLQALAGSIIHLIIGRAVGGLGVGALSMLSPLYMAEISPPEVRGSLIALEQLAIVVGVVFGFWLGFGTRNIPSSMSWRIPLGVQVIPGVILGLGCLLLPASPRLLVLQGKYEEASKSLSVLRRRDQDDSTLKSELLEMRVEALLIERSETSILGPKVNRLSGLVSSWSILFSRRYIRRTMLGVSMMFFQQWSAINVLLYYGPTLVESIGLGSPNPDDQAGNPTNLLVSGGIGIVQFLAVIPAILYIDRWGRKPLLRGGGAIMGCSHFIIALLVHSSALKHIIVILKPPLFIDKPILS